jgi:hypothetical protein
MYVYEGVLNCCRGSDADWLRLSLVVENKARVDATSLELARCQQQRLLHLRDSQEESCMSREVLPKVMAALWELDEEDVENCIDFGQCIQSSIEWVLALESTLNAHSSVRLSIDIHVWF